MSNETLEELDEATVELAEAIVAYREAYHSARESAVFRDHPMPPEYDEWEADTRAALMQTMKAVRENSPATIPSGK